MRQVRISLLIVSLGFVLLALGGSAAMAGTCNTTVVVDWSEDLFASSLNHTCTITQGAILFPAADGKCTLRRALREAGSLKSVVGPGALPVCVNFSGLNPGTDAGAGTNYDAGTGVWTLPVSNSELFFLKDWISSIQVDGQVRLEGPVSARRGAGVSGALPMVYIESDNTLQVLMEDIEIRNVGFIGGTGLHFHEPNVTIENNTFGLSQDGMSVYFDDLGGDPDNLAGKHGVLALSGADDVVISNNVFVGASTKAIEINSMTTGAVITNNLIGTRADGTVPAIPAGVECQATFSHEPTDWYGGWGISLAGSGALIENNVIAGLQNLRSTNDTAPMAIEIFGADHVVRYNQIGEDLAGSPIGSCGQGIKFSGEDHVILENVMVRVREGFDNTEGAILWGDDTFTDNGGNFVVGNLSIDGPPKLFEMSGGIGSTIRGFQSAQIDSIVGLDVTGQAELGNPGNPSLDQPSPCPNCRIDFYLEDLDANDEALEHLGFVIANGAGAFTFQLPDYLMPSEAVRTMSTAMSANIIPGTRAMTTAEPSVDSYQPAVFDYFIFEDGFEGGDTTAWP